MKNKMTILIIATITVILLGSVVYMKMSCTGLWKKQVSKIPNEYGDYVKCVYRFSGMMKKWKEKRFEIEYQLVAKKDFVADSVFDVSFKYPVFEKFPNIEQECDKGACELVIKDSTKKWTLVRVLISNVQNESFKEWVTVNGDLLGQNKNPNGVNYKLTWQNESKGNSTLLFLNQTKPFEKGDELTGTRFKIVHLSKDGQVKGFSESILFQTIIDTFNYNSLMQKPTSKPLGDSPDTTTLNYKSVKPSFSFDYPNLEGYEITTGSNYIEYGIQPSEYDGPTNASVEWKHVVIKGNDDYWEKEKNNKKGVRYKLSEDEDTLTFKLSDQGVFIIFDVGIPGGYLRKKEITDTIIDSFEGIKR